MQADVLVLANLNMDLMMEQQDARQTGRKRMACSFANHPGGNGNNEAVAAAHAGVSVLLAGKVGADLFGQEIKEALKKEQIDCDCVQVAETGSGISLIISAPGQENVYWDIPGANMTVDEGYVHSVEKEIAEAKLLIVGFGVPEKTAILAMELAKQNGTRVMFVGYQSKPMQPKQLALIDDFVMDIHEAETFIGISVTNQKSARIAAGTLLGRGVRETVLLHSKGEFLLLASNGGFVTLRADEQYPLIDASAMDDTLAGVFAACCLQGMRYEQAATVAYRAAMLAGCRKGANGTIPSREEMQEIIREQQGQASRVHNEF